MREICEIRPRLFHRMFIIGERIGELEPTDERHVILFRLDELVDELGRLFRLEHLLLIVRLLFLRRVFREDVDEVDAVELFD